VRGLYDQVQDRLSAYEKLQPAGAETAAPSPQPQPRQPAPRASNRQSFGEAFAKSMLRTIGSQVGRELIRGVLGSLTAASRRRR
jgi:predicted component of type VI protein secretion system